MDSVVSSYTPTVRALSHARAQHTRRKAPSGESGPPRVLAVAMPHTPGARDLPGTHTEYQHLARLFPAVEGLVGEEATRQAVLSQLATHPWAHFACHSGTDPDDPYRSHLLVARQAASQRTSPVPAAIGRGLTAVPHGAVGAARRPPGVCPRRGRPSWRS
ncbi:CHAT domain-containing protein [Streptomyces sp. NPDC101150]|uniref:CHAT domain-containing protein n=1 Tax=Streptomyces sp. NPDC101150 TaxID=3366114 RepID=UPI003814C57A